jgi:aspartate-semialdehyde dehydrogenase
MSKLQVAVLGATGTVGQRMIQLLERHPWFEVSAVCASDNSAGKNYAQVTRWMLETPIPEAVAHNTIRGAAGAALLNAELMYRKGLIG